MNVTWMNIAKPLVLNAEGIKLVFGPRSADSKAQDWTQMAIFKAKSIDKLEKIYME